MASQIREAVGTSGSASSRTAEAAGDWISDAFSLMSRREPLLAKSHSGGDTKGTAPGGPRTQQAPRGDKPLAALDKDEARFVIIDGLDAMIVARSNDGSLAIALTKKKMDEMSEPAGDFFLTALDPKTTRTDSSHFVQSQTALSLSAAAKQLPIRSIASECGWGTLIGKGLEFEVAGIDPLASYHPPALP